MMGRLIRDARLERRWSRVRLSAEANISADYLKRIEGGAQSPGDAALAALAVALANGGLLDLRCDGCPVQCARLTLCAAQNKAAHPRYERESA